MTDRAIPESAGTLANRFGNCLEQIVVDRLSRGGWSHQRHARIGRRLWGDPLVVDVVVDADQFGEFPRGVAIECKWQQVPGSADEKFAFLALNVLHGAYPVPVIVLIDGGGARRQAITWLRNQVDGRRLAHVWTLTEFLAWLNRQPRLPFALIGR